MTASSWDQPTSSSVRPSSSFLSSRFGRRLLLLFAGCALVPVVGLAIVSYLSVNRELVDQAEDRLADTSKSLAMGIWERLAILDAELQIITAQLEPGTGPGLIAARSVLGEDLSSRFSGIEVTGGDGQSQVRWGIPVATPDLSEGEIAHLDAGRPMLTIADKQRGGARILLGRRSVSLGEIPVMIWGEIEPSYLWWGTGRESTLPAGNELVVLDPSRSRLLFSSLPDGANLPVETIAEVVQGSHQQVSWRLEGTEFFGHYRVVNLRPAFLYPGLTLVVGEPVELVGLPLASFKRAFLLILLATMIAVTLVSLRQIRASLMPLEKLREGTRSVAAGNFGVQVAVDTQDEFAELADSFNTMATSLERQFATLTSLNQLQQTVLSALKIDHMVETVLDQFGRIFPCEGVSVCIMNPDRPNSGLINHQRVASHRSATVGLLELSVQEMSALYANRHHLEVRLSEGEPSFAPVVSGERPSGTVFAFPAFLDNELVAMVAASTHDESALSSRDFDAGRQITDQVAIGLSNIRLVHELDNLNWGTLTALARAIDVRSSWTMGHTERVTNLARDIGRMIGLSKERLDTLHRGGLLHDIGKLGVAPAVLDKPGELTTDEMAEVREHVRLGARIIEPIPALGKVVPIVLQHHEWFNGEGYPAGLSGDEICLEARILTVADCYDALSSDRPYREALLHEEALKFILDGSGKQFDPQVVDAFVQLVQESRGPVLAAYQPRDLSPPLQAT